MKIIDLTPEHEPLYCVCLEDWSAEMKEAGDHKRVWCAKMRDRGLRVKLALDDDDRGQVGGMIQYVPIEHALAEGDGLEFILCIWVHGHPQGRGDFRNRGMGTALLAAAEADARDRGVKGMAAWGLWLPFWMRASWFKKHGYAKADRDGIRVLLWKRFSEQAVAPRWIRQKRTPDPVPGKVAVTAFVSGWCPAQNLTYERARRAASEFGDRVDLRAIDTFERDERQKWGLDDALFIDGKAVRTGPPPSFEKLRTMIERRVHRLRA